MIIETTIAKRVRALSFSFLVISGVGKIVKFWKSTQGSFAQNKSFDPINVLGIITYIAKNIFCNISNKTFTINRNIDHFSFIRKVIRFVCVSNHLIFLCHHRHHRQHQYLHHLHRHRHRLRLHRHRHHHQRLQHQQGLAPLYC